MPAERPSLFDEIYSILLQDKSSTISEMLRNEALEQVLHQQTKSSASTSSHHLSISSNTGNESALSASPSSPANFSSGSSNGLLHKRSRSLSTSGSDDIDMLNNEDLTSSTLHDINALASSDFDFSSSPNDYHFSSHLDSWDSKRTGSHTKADLSPIPARPSLEHSSSGGDRDDFEFVRL